MFHLQTGVHFEEIKVAVAINNEFHRARGVVTDRSRQRHGLLAHGMPSRLVQKRRRRFLDDLLVTPLDRAFSLPEIKDGAVPVAQHLYLDMARLGDEFFDEDAIVTKGGFRLVFRGLETLARLSVVEGDAHALAATAGRRLDHDRITDLRGDLHRLIRILDQPHMAGYGGNAGFRSQFLRRDLVTHGLDRADGRTDKNDIRLFQRLRKGSVFRQESVARMDRIRSGLLDRLKDLVDDDIGL